MKKLLFLVLIICSTFSVAEEKKVTEINECYTDIYFGNGILTTRPEAYKNLNDLLQPYITLKYGGLLSRHLEKSKKEIHFDLAYNYSFKEEYGKGVGAIFDLMESYQQLDNTSYGWKTFNILKDLANELALKKNPIGVAVKELIKSYLIDKFVPDAMADFMSIQLSKGDLEKLKEIGKSNIKNQIKDRHDIDLKEQVESYMWSIKSGHGVIIVSHSQGNLFALEAYEELGEKSKESWMQKYFHQVSVASPATKTVKGMDHITFDNDPIVAVIGNLEGDFPNPMRFWKWIRMLDLEEYEDRENMTMPIDDMPIFYNSPCQDEKLPKSVTPMCKNLEGEPFIQNEYEAKDSFHVDFHSFSYYMKEDTSRNKIFKMLDNRRELLGLEKSQWNLTDNTEEDDTECSSLFSKKRKCGELLKKVTHISGDQALVDELGMGQTKVYPFNAAGKVYAVDGKYVKASCGGEAIKEGENEVCYTLEGTGETLSLEDGTYEEEEEENGQPGNYSVTSGAVNVYLSWSGAYRNYVDIDLNVAGPGVKDVSDIENLFMEHYYIANESMMYPGDVYNVGIDGKTKEDKDIPDECFEENPLQIYTTITVPRGNDKYFVVEATRNEQLSIDEAAQIIVTRKSEDDTVSIRRNYIGYGSYSSGEDNTSGIAYEDESCKEGRGRYSCGEGCIPCDYQIRTIVPAVEFGPISGAEVRIIKAEDADKHAAPLYVGKTTVSDDLFKAGIIEMTAEEKSVFEDDEYYIVQATGGYDLDADDDFIMDGIPTKNSGTIHAIMKGSDLKNLEFRVNVLTEAVYQVSADRIGENYSAAELGLHLDDIAKRVLKQKTFITESGQLEISYQDILLWVPTVYKTNLYKNYDTYVEPIVQKVYMDESRVQESYTFIYESADPDAPELRASSFQISALQPKGSLAGVIDIVSHGDSPITHITLSGEGAENFTVENNGQVKVSADANLSKSPFYKLKATAVNENNHTSAEVGVLIETVSNPNIVEEGGSVPYLESIAIHSLEENSPAGTLAAEVVFGDIANEVTGIEIVNNKYFDVSPGGLITVAENATIDYEQVKSIPVTIIATNSLGNQSLPVNVGIPVKNLLDTPVFELYFVGRTEENVPAGRVIGTLDKINDGAAPISSIDILNTHAPFEIDVNGTVRTKGTIDYELEDEYNLVAIARSATGDSNRIQLNIYIDDVVETGMPTAENFRGFIEENAPAGSIVGTVTIDQGESAIVSTELSGVGSTNFLIDGQGVLSVAPGAILDYELFGYYQFALRVVNANGSSATANIIVELGDVPDTLPTLSSFRGSVPENAPAGTEIGKIRIGSDGDLPITSFALAGSGSENFTVDTDGTVFVSSQARLDYESKKSYALKATAISETGVSSETGVTLYVENVPDVPLKAYATSLQIDENSAAEAVVGQIKFDRNEATVDSIILNGDGSENLRVDTEGVVRVAQELDYEQTQHFTLQYTINSNLGIHTASLQVAIGDLPDVVPTLQGLSVSRYYTAFRVDEILGNLLIDEGDRALQHITLSPESPFAVRIDGSLVLERAFSGEQSDFMLTAIASSESGESSPVSVEVHLDAQPVLRDTLLSIEENATAGMIVGDIKVSDQGMNPITEYKLSDTSVFTVDNNGTVRVADALLDYETVPLYELEVTASNRFGESEKALLMINLIDVPDLLLSVDIPSNLEAGSIIGSITDMPEVFSDKEMSMSYSDLFGLDASGNIYLKKTLYEDHNATYILEMYSNNHGEKEKVGWVEINVSSSVITSIEGFRALDVALHPDRKIALVASGYDGLNVIEIESIDNIIVRDTVDTPGYSYDLAVSKDGTRVFVADEGSVEVVDMTDMFEASITDTIDTSGGSYHIVLSPDETKAVVYDEYRIKIIDISDKSSYHLVKTIDDMGYINSADISPDGRLLYVSGGDGDGDCGMRIIDISDVENPYVIGTLDDIEYANDVKLFSGGTKGYMVQGTKIYVFDTVDPAHPYIISTLDMPTYIDRVFFSADETTAVAVNGSSEMYVIDMRDVSALEVTETVEVGYVRQIVLSSDGTRAFVAEGSGGLKVVDIRKPQTEERLPGLYTPLLTIDEDAPIGTVAGRMQFSYTGNSGILSLKLQGDGSEDFSIDSNGTIYLAGSLDAEKEEHYELKVLATNSVGTREIDLVIGVHTVPEIKAFHGELNSMSKAGTLVGKVDTGVDDETTLFDITLSEDGAENFTVNTKGELYVAEGANLHYFEKNQYRLTITAENRFGAGEPATVEIDMVPDVSALPLVSNSIVASNDGTKLYLGGSSGLTIIDISDPVLPTIMGVLQTNDYLGDLTLSPDGLKVFAQMGWSDQAIIMIDVSNANSPSLLGMLNYSNNIRDSVFSKDGTKVFIAGRDSLDIIDVSNPSEMNIISSMMDVDNAMSISLSDDGNIAYVTGYSIGGLLVVEISNPEEPVILANETQFGKLRYSTISSDGKTLYVQTDKSLSILDVSTSSEPRLINTYEMYLSGVYYMSESPDGSKLVIGRGWETMEDLYILDVRDSNNIYELVNLPEHWRDVPRYHSSGAIFSPDGKQLFLDGEFSVLDLTGLE